MRVSAAARYALALDGETLATGVLPAGERAIAVEMPPPSEMSPGRGRLELTVIGAGGSVERAAFSLERTSNAAPHASAGPTRRLRVGQAAVLDATASRDPDGQALTYSWAVLRGPALLEGADTPRPRVTLQSPATAVVELTVADPSGARGTDRAVLRADDVEGPPVLDGEPVRVLDKEPGQTAELTFDASGPGALAVRFEQTAGAAATVDADESHARVRLPETSGLVAFDAIGDNGYDEVRQRILILVGDAAVTDLPATPRATAPPEAPVLSTVVLDATESEDEETSTLGYLWTVEEAPLASLLGSSHIEGNGTAAASQARVVLDRAGLYRFRLRVIDAVGASPTAAEVTVRATASTSGVEVGLPARDVALGDEGEVLAALSSGAVLVRPDGSSDLIDGSVGAVVYSPASGTFTYATDAQVGPAELVRRTPDGVEARQSLPQDDGESAPGHVREMGIGLSSDGAEELLIATDAGLVILMTEDTAEEEAIGAPLFVQGGAVHKPPTFFGMADSSLTDLSVRPTDHAGATNVLSANAFWVIEWTLQPGQSFSTRALDPLGDGEPDAALHLAATAQDALLWLETSGLVWSQGTDGSDCQLLPGSVRSCRAPAVDPCARALSAGPPADVADLASGPDGRLWIASSDGVRVFDPATGTFLLVGAAEGIESVTALDVRGADLAIAAGSQIVWLTQ